MRWFRAEGRLSSSIWRDIIEEAVERRPAPPVGPVVSGTLPAGAFDVETPPSWPAENLRPPPEAVDFNWNP
jgi:hypothetical protein